MCDDGWNCEESGVSPVFELEFSDRNFFVRRNFSWSDLIIKACADKYTKGIWRMPWRV